MIKLEDIIKDLELGKVYTDKDRPPFQLGERVASPFSDHLRKAQNEIEWMISEHGDAEGEGVYSKPRDAIKLLQIAQKSLGKIK